MSKHEMDERQAKRLVGICIIIYLFAIVNAWMYWLFAILLKNG